MFNHSSCNNSCLVAVASVITVVWAAHVRIAASEKLYGALGEGAAAEEQRTERAAAEARWEAAADVVAVSDGCDSVNAGIAGRCHRPDTVTDAMTLLLTH